MDHVRDESGVYTDNERYMDIIPEVVNLSVGYNAQHSKSESLKSDYLQRLLDALCRVDFSALPIERDPAVFDPEAIVQWDGLRLRCGPPRQTEQSLYQMVLSYPDIAATLLEECRITAADFETEICYLDNAWD